MPWLPLAVEVQFVADLVAFCGTPGLRRSRSQELNHPRCEYDAHIRLAHDDSKEINDEQATMDRDKLASRRIDRVPIISFFSSVAELEV